MSANERHGLAADGVWTPAFVSRWQILGAARNGLKLPPDPFLPVLARASLPSGTSPARVRDDMMAAIDTDSIVERAYIEHYPALRRRLTALAHDPATAEDIAQEAFVRLMVAVRAGDVPENIGGWLWRVAHNLIVSRGRRMAVADRRRAELIPESHGASPETLAIRAEAEREVLDALDELDATGRTAVTMAAWGVTCREIARTIGRTDSATRTLLCRARARVRAAVLDAQPG